jgi:hypothetical protein
MPETAAKPQKRAAAAPKPKAKAEGTPTPAKAPKAPEAPKKMGAPKGSGSKYTEEIAEEICALVADGVNLRRVCRMDGMPSWRTVYDWVVAKPDFAARLAHARDIGYDALAEEALEIANTPHLGQKKVFSSGAGEDEDSMTVTEDDMLGHRKLQIETRLKLLAVWNPKKYGNKVQLGGDAENPIKIEAQVEADNYLAAILKNTELNKQVNANE